MRRTGKSYLFLIWACVLLCGTGACKKSSGSPAATPSGPVFNAVVNGTPVSFIGSVSLSGGRFSIAGGLSGAPVKQIILYTSATATGTYPLANGTTSSGNLGTYAEGPTSANLTDYWTDASNTGTLTITAFDAANKTMSGNFNFNAVEYYPQATTATVTISSGTFSNLKWQ